MEILIKLFKYMGYLFIISGLLFLFGFSMLVTGTSKEDFARDLFGFPIPHPPLWTSYIPFVGGLLGIIFELFSLHGLVNIIISALLFGIGSLFLKLSENKTQKGA